MEKDTIQQKKFPKSSKSKKILKALSGLFAIALIVGITIAGTLAYLGKKADTKSNTFKGSAGIDLKIVEPAFVTKKEGESKKEEERANEYTPGGKYLKNPMVYNSSTNDCSEWVAIKVSFQLKNADEPSSYTNVSYGIFSKLAQIQTKLPGSDSMTQGFANQIPSPNWTLINTSEKPSGTIAAAGSDPGEANGPIEDGAEYAIFVYNKAIKNNKADGVSDITPFDDYTLGSITKPIFNQVEVKQQSAIDTIKLNPDIKDYFTFDAKGNITNYPGFRINVEAAAIKNEFNNVLTETLAESLDDVSDSTEVENIKKALIALFRS